MKSALGKFFLLSLLLASSAFAVHIDILYLHNDIGEKSLTEYLQEVYLLITSVLFMQVARHQQQRGFAVLVSAFFCLLLIRELDSLFDLIIHGFWKYPAWIITLSAITYSSFHLKSTINPLVEYTKHSSFSLMLGALATLLVFSRLLGMGELWQGLMQDNYMRGVKNTVEEGVELLAYSLILFSAIWYNRSELKKSYY
ncbi:hypothetical protein BA894_23500 [Vibrio natriegens]|nr:hypothetical protein BA894_23500 [Vibrio natriegens]